MISLLVGTTVVYVTRQRVLASDSLARSRINYVELRVQAYLLTATNK